MAKLSKRVCLDKELTDVLGLPNVYFQPPPRTVLKYPCIIYSKNGGKRTNANNSVYLFKQKYDLQIIYRDPDETISERLMEHFHNCSYDRTYVADGLYHDTLTLYY